MAAITLRTHRVEFFFSNMVMLGTIRSKILCWVKHSESRNAENQQKWVILDCLVVLCLISLYKRLVKILSDAVNPQSLFGFGTNFGAIVSGNKRKRFHCWKVWKNKASFRNVRKTIFSLRNPKHPNLAQLHRHLLLPVLNDDNQISHEYLRYV